MYTQCPECGVAFRVTAEILKQAAGKVRCGGCGHAFNALEHLSEEKPAAPVAAEPEPDRQPPELTPENSPQLEADTPPKTISAAESAALLKTLDQLAGSDIRIEDTGVEWRVLEEGEEEPGETDVIEDVPDDEAAVEQLLQQSFKPIDEVITESASEAPVPDPVEEMRFDDNTPLPEDFDFETSSPDRSGAAVTAEPERAAEPEPEPEEVQVDLAFGDPDEWQDLLGDIDEPAAAAAEEEEQPAAEAVEEAALAAVEPTAVDEESLSDQPPDMDTQFALQAEAMGIDLSGMHAQTEMAPPEDAPAEDDKLDTSIEEDLMAAAFEKEAAERDKHAAEGSEPETPAEPEQLEPVAELELADVEEREELPQDLGAEEETPAPAEVEEPAGIVAEEEAPAPAEGEVEPGTEFDQLAALDEELEELIEESAAAGEPEQRPEEAAEEEIEFELTEDMDEVERKDDVDEIAAVFDDGVEAMIETVSAPGEREESEPKAGDEEHVIPEMSEEEKTINMMIDQELFNIAVEDEDGFASTIVQLQPSKDIEEEIAEIREGKDESEEKEESKKKARKDKGIGKPKTPLVETIIMQGESVHAELGVDEESGSFDKPAVTLPLPQEPDDYARRGEVAQSNRGMIAGIVVLVLLLALQAVHQSREALATRPLFSNAAGPVYRMIGKPLTPTWDISGWRFEATKGNTDENDEHLTIYSRVGNDSDSDLPYPLVHVSLTDRFEEIIGSRVLEPGEYLAENADPRKLVPPGNTFNAVISITSPAPAATGFKLNVCYRLASGQLRCAIEDFK